MKYCCDEMQNHLVYLSNYKNKDHSVIYDRKRRIYAIKFKRCDGREDQSTDIFYCPWCGTKLPSDLSDKWWDVLEEEYGITDPRGDDENRVPPEFKTDQWWKKRGL